MNDELERILADVEKALRREHQPWVAERAVKFLGPASNSTASFPALPSKRPLRR
jgi:hypothetical protein